MSVQTNWIEAERALDAGTLQTLGRSGKWYSLRRNGATKRWKTRPHQASIPVKLGFREAFRLEFDNAAGGCGMALRLWLSQEPNP